MPILCAGRLVAGYFLGTALMLLLARAATAYEAADYGVTIYEKGHWSASCSSNAAAEKKCAIIYDAMSSDKLALNISGTHAFIIFDGVPETVEYRFAFDEAALWPRPCRRICYLAGEDFARWTEALLASHVLRIESPALETGHSVLVDLGDYPEALARVRAFNTAD